QAPPAPGVPLAGGSHAPPAEGAVAALFGVVPLRRLPEPHAPVRARRRVGFLERPTGLFPADGAGHPLDLADAALADQGHGREELVAVLAALLRADLQHALRLLDDPAELLALVDRQGQRLLAVDVLAGPQRGDGD